MPRESFCDLPIHRYLVLTRYLPKSKIRKERNLLQEKLNGVNEQEEPEVRSGALTVYSLLPDGQAADTIVSFWHQVRSATRAASRALHVFSVRILPWPSSRMQPSFNMRNCLLHSQSVCLRVISLTGARLIVQADVHLVPGQRDETGTKGYYNPIIFPNEFWHLRSQYIEINATTPTVPLQIVFQPMSYFKFQLFASMTFGFQEAIQKQGGGSASEIDEVKRMLVETNPWFLALTGVVSVLHVVSVVSVFPPRILTHMVLGLRCWHSNPTSLIGERRMNLLASQSGMFLLT